MQILTTLKRKRDDIERTITAYEGKIAACRRDLAHVIGVLALFEASGEPSELGAHVSIVRLFKRGEVFAICRKALEAAPDGLDTRELALAVIRAKGLDEADAVMRKAVALSIINVMYGQERRMKVVSAGKRRGVRVWTSPVL